MSQQPLIRPVIDLAPFQLDLGGIVIGAGTPIPVGDLEGLGAPSIRSQDQDNPIEDGTFPGQDFYSARQVRIEAGIKTPGDPARAAELLALLQHAVDNPAARTGPGGLAVLRARWPGHATRRLYGRWRRLEVTSAATAINGWLPLDIEFDAMDPYWHADTPSHLTLPLDQARWPKAGLPAPFCEAAACGSLDPSQRPGWITNNGNAPAWPTLRITGPVTNPRVWNTVTSRALELRLALRAGEWVEIETRPGTRWALRNGTASAAGDLTPASRLDLFTIPPGRSEIRWTADDPTDTCRLEVSWRSAYTTI
jgi:hypothetical protein